MSVRLAKERSDGWTAVINVLRDVLGDVIDQPDTRLYMLHDPMLVLRLERALFDAGIVVSHTELFLCETVGDLLSLVSAHMMTDRPRVDVPDELEDED